MQKLSIQLFIVMLVLISDFFFADKVSASSHNDATLNGALLTLPVVAVEDQYYRLDLALMAGADPLKFSITGAEELFNVDTDGASTLSGLTLTVPVLEVEDVSYWLQLTLNDEGPLGFTFVLTGVGVNEAEEVSVTGSWSITENVNGVACEEGQYTESYDLNLTQDEDSLVVSSPAGVFSGTLIDSALRWSGSFAEDGGITSTSISVLFSDDRSSLSGSATWSWSDSSYSCVGSSTISGSKSSSGSSDSSSDSSNSGDDNDSGGDTGSSSDANGDDSSGSGGGSSDSGGSASDDSGSSDNSNVTNDYIFSLVFDLDTDDCDLSVKFREDNAHSNNTHVKCKKPNGDNLFKMLYAYWTPEYHNSTSLDFCLANCDQSIFTRWGRESYRWDFREDGAVTGYQREEWSDFAKITKRDEIQLLTDGDIAWARQTFFSYSGTQLIQKKTHYCRGGDMEIITETYSGGSKTADNVDILKNLDCSLILLLTDHPQEPVRGS